MSRRDPNPDRPANPAPRPRAAATAPAWLPAAFAVVVALAGWNVFEQRGARKELGTKIAEVDAKVMQLQTKVEAAAKSQAQQQPRKGPDPDKVYTIKTAGSPAKGGANAPITIAEFSDFQ